MRQIIIVAANLLFVFNTVLGQNFFVPEYKITTKDDSVYLDLIRERKELNTAISKIENSICYKNTEAKSIYDLMSKIKNGNDKSVSEKFQMDSIVKVVLSRNKLSPVSLFQLAQKFKSTSNHLNWYSKIEFVKRKAMHKKFNKHYSRKEYREFKKYDIKNGEKILEIGSGSIDFALIIGKKRKNCDIYLNDIEKYVLENIYSELHVKDTELDRISKKNSISYHIIQGSETSTGVENIIFDKIIIRKAFHCFSNKNEMLKSIKKSMNKNTILIIKDLFVKSDTEVAVSDDVNNIEGIPEGAATKMEAKKNSTNFLKHYMVKHDFELVMKQNGLEEIYSKKIKTKKGKQTRIYKFRLSR